MEIKEFRPEQILGDRITELDRKSLCEMLGLLCDKICDEVGASSYRGGVYPENISLDDEGHLGLGEAKGSDWAESELDFLAPEVFWKGELSSAADVYSLGMLLYYAINSGKLPFAKSGPEKARERRLAGESFAPPRAAGRRLGEIIARATAFKAEERYANVAELKAMIDSCVKNLYLSGAPSAETVFQKQEGDLSQVERMMVSILERGDAPEPEEPSEETEAPEEEPAEPEAEQEPEPAPEPEKPARQPIPILTEEKNPELEPIRPKKRNSVQYQKSAEREKKIRQKVRRRRLRPILFILFLCAVLFVCATLYNRITLDEKPQTTPEPQSTQAPIVVVVTPPPVETPEPTAVPKVSTYEIYVENVSWSRARELCEEKGGHLVVISDENELNLVANLAIQAGVSNVWIGCSRVDGELRWVTGESVDYYPWDTEIGEPSYIDAYDQVDENYLMLWNRNGWSYNDNRNDPYADYPWSYGGNLAYVCEYEN